MSLEILIPIALLALERFLTARGLKHKVPAQLADQLAALAEGNADKVPAPLKAALDAYVAGQVKRQIDHSLEQLSGASKRLDESFARAGAVADAIKEGKPLSEVAKLGRPKGRK